MGQEETPSASSQDQCSLFARGVQMYGTSEPKERTVEETS
jgi:hypothetical protein